MSDIRERMLERVRATPPGPAVPWFMDVDGVLNVIGPRPTGDWGFYERIVVHHHGLGWPVVYAPDLVSVINSMVDEGLIEIHWLTTWEQGAPTCFAPAVGLHVGDRVVGNYASLGPVWWKLAAVHAHRTAAESGLFVWADDEIRMDPDASPLLELAAHEGVVINCDEMRGLTPADLDRVLDAIWDSRTLG